MSGGFYERICAAMHRSRAARRSARAKKEAIRRLSFLSSGRATEADAAALKQWCRDDPAHEEAYARAALVWDLLQPVAVRAPSETTACLSGLRSRPVEIGRRAFLGGAVAASACIAGYTVVHPPLGLWPSLAALSADVRTGTGERRQIALGEGVTVELNTRSSLGLDVASGPDRRIALISGEAIIAAGPDAANACIVTAGDGRIFARDAKVNVRYDGADVRVTCVDGSVRVERGAQGVTVAAGEQVVYGSRGISGAGAADAAAVTAWQRGLLVFRQERLSRVLEEVNRYRPGEIVLLDRDLGRRLIDARFRIDHLENVIIYLQQAFDVRVTSLPGGIVLVS